MRGQIRIESEIDKGTTFYIELPLTLAIIDGIETIVGDERFIVPTLSVLEFMKTTPDMSPTTVGKAETFLFRGDFLPLYRLSRLFDITAKPSSDAEEAVVVVSTGGEMVALLVDDIAGSCQTVIKNLGAMFANSPGIAGCAIMTNGDIRLILDIRSVVQCARDSYRHVAPWELAAQNAEIQQSTQG